MMNDGSASPLRRLSEPFERGRVTSISTAPQRRQIVLVLGMHRSGTSLCSHVLSALGLDMADRIAPPGLAEPAADNRRGHWERWEIVDFHDRILGLFNRGYYTPFHDFPLPVAWWADPRVAGVRREIADFLEQRMGKGHFGFKDPRAVRLMPIWHQIANELGLAPKIVFCLRNPAQVARSLHAREGLPAESGEYRWLTYVIDFFRNIRDIEFCTIEYEDWFEEPAPNLLKLRKFLDLPMQPVDSDVDLAIGEIIAPELRHDDPRGGEARQPLVRSVYNLTRRAGHDPAARDQVKNIAAQFTGFQQTQGAFQRAFERTAAIAEKLPSVEQAAAVLRDAVRERDAAAAAADERARTAEAGLAEALSQLQTQRLRLTEIEAERDDRAAVAEAARADLVSAQAQAGERDAAAADEIEILRRETAELTVVAARAGDEAKARLTDVETLRNYVVRLRGALAEARHATGERAVEAEALRGALAEAQRRAEGADVLRREIAELRDALAVAREVGQAVLKTLAADGPAVVPPGEAIGWWRALKRRFGRSGIP
jgi:hypothetical protein